MVTAAQPHITAYFNPVNTTETITPVSILSNIVEILSKLKLDIAPAR